MYIAWLTDWYIKEKLFKDIWIRKKWRVKNSWHFEKKSEFPDVFLTFHQYFQISWQFLIFLTKWTPCTVRAQIFTVRNFCGIYFHNFNPKLRNQIPRNFTKCSQWRKFVPCIYYISLHYIWIHLLQLIHYIKFGILLCGKRIWVVCFICPNVLSITSCLKYLPYNF